MKKMNLMLGDKLAKEYLQLLQNIDFSCMDSADSEINTYRKKVVDLLEGLQTLDINHITVACNLVRSLKDNFTQEGPSLSEKIFKRSINDSMVVKIITWVFDNASEEILTEDIADEFTVCKRTIDRRVKLVCNSGRDLIRKVKIYKTKQRLLELSTPAYPELLEIAGYNDKDKFNSDFKLETGYSPMDYREKFLQ